jgi:hypothetical protein
MRKIILQWVLPGILIIFIIWNLIPQGDKSVLYRSANDKLVLYESTGKDPVVRSSNPPKYIIKDEKLYLRYLTSRGMGPMALGVYGFLEKWTKDDFSQFRKSNPDIERYLPNPEDTYGGIVWLKDR